jgi:hypothetical protein
MQPVAEIKKNGGIEHVEAFGLYSHQGIPAEC